MDLVTSSAHPPGDERPSSPKLSRATQARVLLAVALGPLITGYAVVAALLALLTVTAENTQFSTLDVLLAAGPGWLAAHQVPIAINGHPLGLLPLLPAIGVAALIARTAARAAQRLGCRKPRQSIAVVGVLAGAHAAFGLLIAVISSGSVAAPVTAFLVPGVFAALAATAGLAKRCGLVSAARAYVDPPALHGLRAGALGMAGLLASGAVVFMLSLALSASTVYKSFEPGFGTSFGLFLVSLGYLPNAIVAGLSFAAGPGFSIGSVTISPIRFSGGSVPSVPLLAGIPDHHAVWWPVLVLLPAATGALVGWSVRKIDDNPVARLRTVGVAGALVGFGCVVLGTLAGGRLGDGPFNPVSVPVGVASVIAFCWIVIPGGLVAFFAGVHEPHTPPSDEIFDDGEAEAVAEDTDKDAVEPADSEPTENDEAADVADVAEVAEDTEEEVAEDTEEAEAEAEEDDDKEPEPEADVDVTDSTVESGDESEPESDR